MTRFGVLVSGSGTNLQSIIDACAANLVGDSEVAVVISNREDAYGLTRAAQRGIPAVFIDPTAYADAVAYNHAIREALELEGVDYVVMAGYMKLLGAEVLDAFPMRVLNIHPALLPSFAGAHGIRDAFEYGVKVTGVTVHFASEIFDQGPIIAQEAVEIEHDDTLETLEARIHEVEHRLYPAVLAALVDGRVIVEGRTFSVLPRGARV
jgi:phosphoribosylglycinamide formyltransferase-1